MPGESIGGAGRWFKPVLCHRTSRVGERLEALQIEAGFRAVGRHLPAKPSTAPVPLHRKQWVRESAPYLLLAGAQTLNHQTDVLMLGFLAAQAQVGLYRVATQIADGVAVPLFAISVVIAPQLARLHTLGNEGQIQKILVVGHRIGALAMVPLAVPVAWYSTELLMLIFGAEFGPAASALRILALGKIAYGTVGFSGVALSMLGSPGAAAVLTLATVLLNATLNFYLIPLYGTGGAAAATATSAFVIAMISALYVRQKIWIWNISPAPHVNAPWKRRDENQLEGLLG